jgi:hypothetical protein
MIRWVPLVLLILIGFLIEDARGQELPDAPVSKATWATFAGFGTEILADGVMTRVLYQRGYDEIDPLAKPFVHTGVPGQVGASLLGAGVMSGAWFVLRRTHHNHAASWFLRSATAGEGYNVARQVSILRTSQSEQAAGSADLKSQSAPRFCRRCQQ